eukprot:1157016-Pelagomonas_calceolata.AAC.2
MQARNAAADVFTWLLPDLINGTLANVSKSCLVRRNGRYCSKPQDLHAHPSHRQHACSAVPRTSHSP